MGKKTLSEDDLWWRKVKCRLVLPCDGNTSTCNNENTLQKSILEENTGVESTEVTEERKCSPLHDLLRGPVMEAWDVADSLLRNKKISCYGRGKWLNEWRLLKRSLKLSVRRKKRKQLGSEKTKLLSDMLQIVSFSHYVHIARESLRGRRNLKINFTMRDLETKMLMTVCKMRPAFGGEPLQYLAPGDVPADLRRQKRSSRGHVATYVILQAVRDFFQRLTNGYQGSSLKVCYV